MCDWMFVYIYSCVYGYVRPLCVCVHMDIKSDSLWMSPVGSLVVCQVTVATHFLPWFCNVQ